MQPALGYGELKQRVLIPKQVIGITAVLLAGATITPVNIQTAHKIIGLGMGTNQTATIKNDLSVEKTLNLKAMEQRAGNEIFVSANIATITLVDNKKDALELRDKIISSVLDWQGIKYMWGGQTKAGVDCSGLVQNVFNQQGIQLPRTSYEQFRQGVGVPRTRLEAGDLVFFNTNGSGASHVGIYVGNGEFISATRNCVEIQSLDQPYWDNSYRGSRRVLG